MSNSKSVKVDSTGGYSQDLIDLVVARAVDSKEWRKLLTKVEAAGDIEGAIALKSVGQNIWHVVADKTALVAAIAVVIGAPITAHLMTTLTAKATELYRAFDAAESALCEGGTQEEIDACTEAKRVAREAAYVVEALTDFRCLCGVVSAGVKQAQKNAESLAKSTWCVAEKGSKAKNAGDAIKAMLKRDLNKYGVLIDWRKCEATSCEIKEKGVDTDAQKAAKAIASAFKHSPDGAIDALLLLDPTTRGTIKNAIEAAEKAAIIETQKQDTEHKQGAVEELTDKALWRFDPLTGKPYASDMFTVLNAGDSATEAARRLADLEAAGTTPEQEANLQKAGSKGRRVSGL